MCHLTYMGSCTGHARATEDCLRVLYGHKIVGSMCLKVMYAQLSARGYTAPVQVQNVQQIVRARTACGSHGFGPYGTLKQPGTSCDQGICGAHF